MTLPTFLNIGVPRAGTTWLYELLASHPEVFVTKYRKEVWFFNTHYERGIKWYENFFPSYTNYDPYKAIGEISSEYLYDPRCPERIADIPSITKMTLILRNPVDRAYSHYGLKVRNERYSRSFETYLKQYPHAIHWGFYSRYIKKYLKYFKKDQILVLVFEQAVRDISKTKEILSRFLGLDGDAFPLNAGIQKVNKSYLPKARFAYGLAGKVARKLREWDLNHIIYFIKKMGINERLFGESSLLPPMNKETNRYLRDLYENEVIELESLLQLDLECWK